jgi:hypothetical protein
VTPSRPATTKPGVERKPGVETPGSDSARQSQLQPCISTPGAHDATATAAGERGTAYALGASVNQGKGGNATAIAQGEGSQAQAWGGDGPEAGGASQTGTK